MPERDASSWTLVREVGLEYAPPDPSAAPLPCAWPFHAQRMPGGAHLVVDDAAADADPLRSNGRTRVFSARGEVAFDSAAQGLDDAFGCTLEGDRFAVLGRARSELVVMSLSAGLQHHADLSAIARAPASVMARTPRGTLVIAFLAGINDVGFAEVDPAGRVTWALPTLRDVIGNPASLQELPDGSLLVADEFHHVVWTLGRDGGTAIAWGKWHAPSRAPGHLHRPKSARRYDDGTLLIADAHNHRVVQVDRDGSEREVQLADGELCTPTSAMRLREGNLLVCDAMNRCVLEVDAAGRTAWRLGAPGVRRRLFSFPRSVELAGEDHYLVADTGNDRVVEVSGHGTLETRAGAGSALFWPRAARRTPAGTLIVADGRNARVLEICAQGRPLQELRAVQYRGENIELGDPHDVRALPGDRLLIVDSQRHLVIKTDWSGRAAWVIGPGHGMELLNPHSAQEQSDGRVLIADSQNDRVVIIDPATGKWEALAGLGATPLKSPKYAERAPDGTLVVVDTGNHRVIVAHPQRRILRELVRAPQSPQPALRAPRWARCLGPDELVVSDHSNHRILHLRWNGARP